MKKVSFIYLFAICTILFSSCAREAFSSGQEIDSVPVFPMTFTAGFEETKAQLSFPEIIWQEGDAIAVWDGTAFRKFTLTSGANTAKASFGGEAGKADSYTLVYPYDESLGFIDGQVTATMPATQTIGEKGGSPREALLCIGVASDASQATLKRVFSAVRINVPAGVSSIAFEGNVSTAKGKIIDALAGKASIDPATGDCTAIDSTSTVVVNVPAEGGEVIFATLPSPLACGFKLALRKDGEDCDAIYTVSKDSYPLVRNSGISINSIPTPVYNKFFVRDAADFKKIATSENIQKCPVILGADIDFEGETIPSIPAFSGSFDGQGHKLYNVLVKGTDRYVGLFEKTTGPVKNFVFGSKDGKTADGTSRITMSGYSDASKMFCTGLIGQAQADVESVSNFADILVEESVKSRGHIGGIIGMFNPPRTIGNMVSDCYSDCTIDVRCDPSQSFSDVGGIIGRNDADRDNETIKDAPAEDKNFNLIVKNCNSNALITSNSVVKGTGETVLRAGGIVGVPITTTILIDGCGFSGTISTSAASQRAGGIIGFASSPMSFRVRDCSFSGTIDSGGDGHAAGCLDGANSNSGGKYYIENFTATETATLKITNGSSPSFGMIVAAPLVNITAKSCRIAGKVILNGVETVLTPENFANYIQASDKLAPVSEVRFITGEEPVNPPTPPTPPTPENAIKILAVGNSFSEDSMEHGLPGLLLEAGIPFIIGDAYISGCPLDKHWDQTNAGAASYSYRKFVNSVSKTTKSNQTFKSIIQDEEWDIISFQQGAGFHGFYESVKLPDIAIQDWSLSGDKQYSQAMDPSLTYLINYCRNNAAKKDFKVAFNACWASTKLTSGAEKCLKFSYYEYDQDKMYNAIVEATKICDQVHKFDYVFDCNSAIQNGRTSYIGDKFGRGGDGWHLQDGYGRLTANCVWFEVLTGLDCRNYNYVYNCTPEQGKVAKEAAHAAVANPYKVTDLSWIPNPGSKPAVADTLAIWYFTPARAVSDGCSETWTGQTKPGVIRWSKEPGLTGTYKANGTLANGKATNGMISYYQVDKTGFSNSKGGGYSIYDAGTGGQPVFGGGWPGDYLLFESTGNVEISDGTKMHFKCTITPMLQGPKYYKVEYLDGNDQWVAPKSMPLTTKAVEGGETASYNVTLSSKTKYTIDFTETLSVGRTDFKVRITCAAKVGVDGVVYSAPNDNIDGNGKYQTLHPRITGTPGNGEHPLIEIRKD